MISGERYYPYITHNHKTLLTDTELAAHGQMDITEKGENESQLGPDWAELTHECLINILARLPLEHRWLGPMLVCKSWLQACKDPSLHSVFDLETLFESANECARWWSTEFERRVDSILRSVVDWSDGSLTEIRTRHCSNRSLALVAERYEQSKHTRMIFIFIFCLLMRKNGFLPYFYFWSVIFVKIVVW